MKKLQFLKALVDLIWLSSIVGILALTVFIVYIFIKGNVDIPIKMNGENFNLSDTANKILLIFATIAYVVFVFGIYELRKLLSLFAQRLIFEDENVLLLNRIGKCFLISTAIIGIPLFAYNVFYKNKISIEIGGGFSSFLFAASLGLFFMVLSEVFKTAKTMKDENDLTV